MPHQPTPTVVGVAVADLDRREQNPHFSVICISHVAFRGLQLGECSLVFRNKLFRLRDQSFGWLVGKCGVCV